MRSSPAEVVVSGRLRVVFERRDDRWGHQVEWRTEDGRFVPLLQSFEGLPGEEILPSPPLQELTMQQSGDGAKVGLGVGMAGRNHWSIAFTPANQAPPHPAENRLEFGLACRLRDHVSELRSSYQLMAPLRLRHADPGTLELASADVRLRVHSSEMLVGTEAGFAIIVGDRPSQPTPYTEKWCYSIRCDSVMGA